MAFLIHSIDGADVLTWEYLPCSAITPKVGLALTFSGGNLAVASGSTVPTYISMCEKDVPCAAGDIIPVIRVGKNIVFETCAQAALTSVKPGDKLTIYTDGLQVTATNTSGICEVVSMEAAAAGSKVLVRF